MCLVFARRALLLSAATLLGCSGGGDKPVAYTDVLHDWGQSNRVGPFTGNVPAGIPLGAILMRNWTETQFAGEENWSSPRALNVRDTGKRGTELSRGLALNAAGLRIFINKVATSSTSVVDWLPTATDHANLWDKWASQTTTVLSELPTLFPGTTFRHWLFPNQGEQDSSHAGPAAAWAGGFASLRAAMEGVIGQPFNGVLGTRTRLDSGNVGPCTTLRASQAAAYDRYVDADDVALDTDGVHYLSSSANIIGDREAAAFLLLINDKFPPAVIASNELPLMMARRSNISTRYR